MIELVTQTVSRFFVSSQQWGELRQGINEWMNTWMNEYMNEGMNSEFQELEFKIQLTGRWPEITALPFDLPVKTSLQNLNFFVLLNHIKEEMASMTQLCSSKWTKCGDKTRSCELGINTAGKGSKCPSVYREVSWPRCGHVTLNLWISFFGNHW